MKKYIPKIFTLALFSILLSGSAVRACNLSDVTFTSFSGSGPFVIGVRLCVGTGITGATKGGDQGTTNMLFGFWDNLPGVIVTAFTPASFNGPPPNNCLMNGSLSAGGPFGTRSIVGYTATGCGTSGFGCVSTTVACGNARAWCNNFTFTVNRIPDSIRVFGAEGGGNPIGGCYPNPDMKIDFSSFPVLWGDIEGIRSTAGINVKWSTLREVDTDYMIVERSIDQVSFESIGELPSAGNSSAQVRYQFFDPAPVTGSNWYRIVQVDRNGASYDSEIIEVNYFKPEAITWGNIGPNPTSSAIDFTFYSPRSEPVKVILFDVTGKVDRSFVMDAIIGGNSMHLDLNDLNRGAYYLSVQGAGEKLIHKVIKL